jgi:hypothetical protein
MNAFEGASRPVIFESGHDDFAYWGKGSSFLISNSSNYYWVTASHVLNNMGGCANTLRIFPSDNQQYTVNRGETDDEDYKDVFMLRVDLSLFDASGDSPLVAQDIERGTMSADLLRSGDELWIIGYPAESNFIDYEINKIENTRSVLRAIYNGTSVSVHCHELLVKTSVNLESYDGLSGSPVYYMKEVIQGGEIISFPLLVGMLLRGTASSRIAHFVNSDVLSNIISLAEEIS